MEPTPRNSPDKRLSCSQNWSNTFLILRLFPYIAHTHTHTHTHAQLIDSFCPAAVTATHLVPPCLKIYGRKVSVHNTAFSLLGNGQWKTGLSEQFLHVPESFCLPCPSLPSLSIRLSGTDGQSEEYRAVYIWPGGFLKAGRVSYCFMLWNAFPPARKLAGLETPV